MVTASLVLPRGRWPSPPPRGNTGGKKTVGMWTSALKAIKPTPTEPPPPCNRVRSGTRGKRSRSKSFPCTRPHKTPRSRGNSPSTKPVTAHPAAPRRGAISQTRRAPSHADPPYSNFAQWAKFATKAAYFSPYTRCAARSPFFILGKETKKKE